MGIEQEGARSAETKILCGSSVCLLEHVVVAIFLSSGHCDVGRSWTPTLFTHNGQRPRNTQDAAQRACVDHFSECFLEQPEIFLTPEHGHADRAVEAWQHGVGETEGFDRVGDKALRLQAEGLLFNDVGLETPDHDAADEFDVLGEEQPDDNDEDTSDATVSGDDRPTQEPQHDKTTATAKARKEDRRSRTRSRFSIGSHHMLRRLVALGVMYGNLSKRDLKTAEWKNNTNTAQRRHHRRPLQPQPFWHKPLAQVSYQVWAVVFCVLSTVCSLCVMARRFLS